MAKLSSQPLKLNPFVTYRDPETGIWRVVPSAYDADAPLASQVPQDLTTDQASPPKP